MVIYGTKRTSYISSIFDNYRDVSEIRKTMYEFNTVVILDDAVESILNLPSLVKFAKRVNPELRLILLYENHLLQVYTNLFDYHNLVKLNALNDQSLLDAIEGTLDKTLIENMLNKDLTYQKYELPKVLPIERNELIDLINEFSNKLVYQETIINSMNKKYIQLVEEKQTFQTYVSKLLDDKHSLERRADIQDELLVNLMKFRDEVLLNSGGILVHNASLPEDVLPIVINIKAIDDLLYIHTILKTLQSKIIYQLDLPTKVVILEESPSIALRKKSDIPIIYNNYSQEILLKEDYLIKVGYNKDFMQDLLTLQTKPNVIIVYNTIRGVSLSNTKTIDLYAARSNPSQYSILQGKEAYTITNYEGYPLSFPFNELKFNNKTIPNSIFLSAIIFTYIVELVSTVFNKRTLENARRLLDAEEIE